MFGLHRSGAARAATAISVALLVMAVGSSPGAQVGGWQPRFDAGNLGAASVSTARPILSPEAVADIDLAIVNYRRIVAAGGWPIVPVDAELQLGVQHPNVILLRQRLAASHDLDPARGLSDVFDSYVDRALRRFQERHGLPADGIVDQVTFSALNVPADVRLGQLEANRTRLQDLASSVPARYVLVNLPGAQIEAVEDNRVITRHTAVVGRVDRQTPILTSAIYEVNFNPFWTVPASIIERDLIPLMQEQPDYLTEQRIRMYDGQGREIMPEEVDWFSDEATRYVFRQDPGDQNALGSVRINFNNAHAVYLHDTPDKTLFGNDYRFDSSGCVRVKDVRQLIAWLLRDTPQWPREQIEATIASGDRVNAQIANPVRLYLAYITAWSADGVVHFRDDIYGRDGVGEYTVAADN